MCFNKVFHLLLLHLIGCTGHQTDAEDGSPDTSYLRSPDTIDLRSQDTIDLRSQATRHQSETDLRSSLWSSPLIHPGSLPAPETGVLDVAFIMLNVEQNKTEQRTNKLVRQFVKMVDSLFFYSQGTPLRMIFLTDYRSRPVIGQLLSERAGKYLTEAVIRDPSVTVRDIKLMVPRLKVEYVRAGDIIRNHREDIEQFKSFFGTFSPDGKGYTETPWKQSQGISVISWSRKYLADLFYLLPFHHLEFPPSLRRLILLDVDLEFKIDLVDLYKQFRDWGSEEVIGCGVTQSPFYFSFFENYRKIDPDTKIGRPGRFQGLNTGVLLLKLDKMRQSSLYKASCQVERVREMREKYQMSGAVGDQDWLTLVSFEHPELVHILGCEYNKEEHRPGECHQDTVEEWEVRDKDYHNCPRRIKIRHRAGSI